MSAHTVVTYTQAIAFTVWFPSATISVLAVGDTARYVIQSCYETSLTSLMRIGLWGNMMLTQSFRVMTSDRRF